MAKIAFLVQRIGPYHHARLRAFATKAVGRLAAIEFRADDAVYAWDAVREDGGYERIQTHSRGELCRALDRLSPDVVICVGYSDPEIHQAVAWALSRRVPLVTCSDSTYDDEPRSWAKETFKRRIVSAFDAALVAGRRARDYLGTLGLDHDRCFQPWDVVDNAEFARGADLARREAAATRKRLGLPERYFFCVARLVPKKNLARLIDAHGRYVARAREDAWSLVISGAGPLEAELRSQAARIGPETRVRFPGFLQYPDLPSCYGLAGAFVLPSVSDQWGLVVNEAMASALPVLVSSRCGCAPDLVQEGRNGFTFDPDNVPGLAACLARVAELGPVEQDRMGKLSRAIVAAFTPEAFAEGLEAAVACAFARRRARIPWPIPALFHLLAMRRAKAP